MKDNLLMGSEILIFGGKSDERLVSFASAQNLCNKHDFAHHWFLNYSGEIFELSKNEILSHPNPFENEFRPQKNPIFATLSSSLNELKKNILFLGFHGTEGEDGHIQNLLENKITRKQLILDVPLDNNGNPVGQPSIINPTDPINVQRYKLKYIDNTSGTRIPSIGIIVSY